MAKEQAGQTQDVRRLAKAVAEAEHRVEETRKRLEDHQRKNQTLEQQLAGFEADLKEKQDAYNAAVGGIAPVPHPTGAASHQTAKAGTGGRPKDLAAWPDTPAGEGGHDEDDADTA